jgi:hypothetical protein
MHRYRIVNTNDQSPMPFMVTIHHEDGGEELITTRFSTWAAAQRKVWQLQGQDGDDAGHRGHAPIASA